MKAKTVREELDRKRSFWGGNSRNKMYQQPLNTTTVSSTNLVGYQSPLLGQYYPYMPPNHHSSLKSTHTAFTVPMTTASSNNNNCAVIQYGSMPNSAPPSQDASVVKAASYNDTSFLSRVIMIYHFSTTAHLAISIHCKDQQFYLLHFLTKVAKRIARPF